MPLEVTESYVLVQERITYTPDGGMIDTSMSIVGRLGVALPTYLSLAISFDWRTDDRSTTTCTGEVLDSSNAVVGTGEVVLAPESEIGRSRLPLSRFRVTVTGTYTVRLYVDSVCVSTESFVIESV